MTCEELLMMNGKSNGERMWRPPYAVCAAIAGLFSLAFIGDACAPDDRNYLILGDGCCSVNRWQWVTYFSYSTRACILFSVFLFSL